MNKVPEFCSIARLLCSISTHRGIFTLGNAHDSTLHLSGGAQHSATFDVLSQTSRSFVELRNIARQVLLALRRRSQFTMLLFSINCTLPQLSLWLL